MKQSLLKDYQALLLGVVTTSAVALMLVQSGFLIIDADYAPRTVHLIGNTLIFCACCLFTAWLFHQFSMQKVLGLLGLLVITSVSNDYLQVFNPVTIPVLILFWLGVAYLIIPTFFKKYQLFILGVYGLVILYFFITRTLPNYVEDYHQLFLNFMLVPLPAFAMLWIYEQWKWMKTLQLEKAEAELMLLKSQINPHFFFNTLNNLYGLVVEKSDQAPEVVLRLSDMMRYTIYEGKEDRVSLGREIDYLKTYIELHKLRHQKTIDIRFTHAVEKDLQVAPLLFIILLENAFKHGIERLTANAYIYLTLNTKGTTITFTIKNNYDVDAPARKPGIGLENLKRRLAHIYPDRYKLDILKTADTYTVNLTLEADEIPNNRR